MSEFVSEQTTGVEVNTTMLMTTDFSDSFHAPLTSINSPIVILIWFEIIAACLV